jgi:hypothetical protein
MIVKDEPDSWFKPGTEVWDQNTGSRFTEEEYNKWTDSGNIVVCGIRVSEADGTEYEDGELCGFDINRVKPLNEAGCFIVGLNDNKMANFLGRSNAVIIDKKYKSHLWADYGNVIESIKKHRNML